MNKIEELKQKINSLKEQLKPLEDELGRLYNEQHEETEKRIRKCNALQDKFDPENLIYSATSKCICEHGLAYPKNTSISGSWYCSAILTGVADVNVPHTSGFPFAFYDIKSENQPSANGATTRPVKSETK